MIRNLFALCAVLALAGVAKGSSLQVILFGVPAMYMLLELYPPKGGNRG